MTIVCGDSHTSTHGAFGALAFGIGTSEVEHVLATQCLVQRRPRSMRISYSGELGRGVTAKDLILATIGRLGVGGMAGHAVEYAGPAIARLSMENRMTICNMTIEGGGRAGMVAPDDTTFAWMEGRPGAPGDFEAAVERWRALPTDEGAEIRHARSRSTPASLSPMVTWGTTPGMVVEVTDAVPDPAGLDAPADRESAERALAYMDLEPGTPMREIALDRVFIGSCTNSRIEDLRGRRELLERPAVARAGVDAMVVPGSQQVKAQAEAEGLRRDLRARRLRLAQRRLLDVPGHEPRHPQARASAAPRPRTATSRAARARGGRTHLVSPADGGRRRGRGPFRRHPGVEPQ